MIMHVDDGGGGGDSDGGGDGGGKGLSMTHFSGDGGSDSCDADGVILHNMIVRISKYFSPERKQTAIKVE